MPAPLEEAVAVSIDPIFYQTKDLYVTIETQSPNTRGRTVADRRSFSGQPPNARVCLGVDAPRLAVLLFFAIFDGSGLSLSLTSA